MRNAFVAIFFLACCCIAQQSSASPTFVVEISEDGNLFYASTDVGFPSAPVTFDPSAYVSRDFSVSGTATSGIAPSLDVDIAPRSSPLTAGHEVQVAVTETGVSSSDIVYFLNRNTPIRSGSALSSAMGATYYDASDRPFAMTTVLDATPACSGQLNGCVEEAYDTIDTSIPYSITEIFDATFTAGYDSGDLEYEASMTPEAVIPRSAVPEPASFGLVGLGLVALGVSRRKRVRPAAVGR